MNLMKSLSGILLVLFLIALPVYNAAAQTPGLPDEAFVSGVPSHAQSYTLSCESRSAADWAAYFGVDVSETTFLDNLPRSDNPEKGFVGDPNGYWGNIPPLSYGVHAAPVAAGLRAAGLAAEAHKGLSWDDLRSEIASGQPVIIWVIGQMWTGTPIQYTAVDGEVLTVAYFEHSMILTGYSPTAVNVIDAYSGLHQTFNLDTFLDSWSVLGNQAIIYAGESLPERTQERLEGETYTVQPGDYLNGLAEQFGLAWQDLADWNRLDPPYTIFAGQELLIAPAENAEEPEPEQVSAPSVEPPTSKPGVYTITSGDTLLNIAGRFGTTWQELAAVNGLLHPFFIYPGQDLQLPADARSEPETQAAAAPVESASSEPASPETYTVQRGDGLMAVARDFGLDWLNLAELNGIEYPYTLYPGRILLLK